ncbi:non-specific lipid-transfer protein 2-like [Rhododendron vialii]|uniref:non-specific lipid-transfer protein 2-like n=1 Tax=Rhododendron vialii TaxID=182163 RepID=UPI00265E219F|nr:non-specific lipid-transfer protein 2-like [Rhododendron vialii]
MKKGSCASLLCALVVVLVVLEEARVTEAVTCNPMELSSCQGSFTSSAPPAAGCCVKLREQQPCFCGYKKNPSLGQYVNSPNARRVASACGVSYPNC